MEESKLYMARVQVVEAMEQGPSVTSPAREAGWQEGAGGFRDLASHERVMYELDNHDDALF